MLASKSVEAVARQPQERGTIQRLMILGIAFIEALCLYAFVVSLMLIGKGKDEKNDEPSHDEVPTHVAE